MLLQLWINTIFLGSPIIFIVVFLIKLFLLKLLQLLIFFDFSNVHIVVIFNYVQDYCYWPHLNYFTIFDITINVFLIMSLLYCF